MVTQAKGRPLTGRLSRPIHHIEDRYDAVVVGTGYGGAIAASRLARMGLQVCVLERGRELRPGEYPDRLAEAAEEFQVDYEGKHVGNKTALYDVRVNKDMNVFVGCGLGGTSLVNANVAIRPDPRVLRDKAWPDEIRSEADDPQSALAEGFRRAEAMLAPSPFPARREEIAKLDALNVSAAYLRAPFGRPPLTVAFQDAENPAGIGMKACVNCGDCVSGCNFGAKGTVLMNYLPDASNHGAHIFCELAVTRVARTEDGARWRVFFQPAGLGRSAFDSPPMFVLADIVVLAAGVLGTSEILLRSSAAGLAVSPRLGKSFTGNGDVLAFGYNNDREINGIGFGDNSPAGREPVGPCITGMIDKRGTDNFEDGLLIEEGAIPGALASILPGIFAAGAAAYGKDMDEGILDRLHEKAREIESAVRGAYHGAVRNTQTYLIMGHDDYDGEMVLKDDRLRINWPKVAKKPLFKRIEKAVEQAVKATGGTYVRDPLTEKLLGQKLITVHPLGGCAMGTDAEKGVVDHRGRVFNSKNGPDVYDSLLVTDGAVVPRSVGSNPFLTISALAERSMQLLSEERGLTLDVDAPSRLSPAMPEPALGIQFTERMGGYVSEEVGVSYEAAAASGEKENSKFAFTVSILSDDLDKMLHDPNHVAPLVGTVEAAALSEEPLTVTRGRFQLLVKDPDTVGVRRMTYRMRLTDRGGRHWYLDGFKTVRDDRGFDLWSDTTTLYVDIHDGEDGNAPIRCKGILKVAPGDFAIQLSTMRARNAGSLTEGKLAVARFGRFFAGALADAFGGGLAPDARFDPAKPPRTRRPLELVEAELHDILAEDGVGLRLTRYRGGDKGPVMLSHGLGVSSAIFSLDTIRPNLLEYLARAGYDVWLLDWRGSIALEASRGRFTLDDVALYDYPAAVQTVRNVTGAAGVDMVAHCVGAATFIMSLLRGNLDGVRSALCSQMVAHMRTPPLSRLKAALYMPSVLKSLGVDRLDAYTDTTANWLERLYDSALRLYPIEAEDRSNNPVARRITFIYGQLWELENLNTATHDALHELFGVANIDTLQHLAVIARRGHLVTRDGGEDYLPNLYRLKLPMTILHGAENACFYPESTRISYDMLVETNGPECYRRKVIPGYGHIDCIFGANAHRDVFPHILEHLEAVQASS